MVRRLAPLSTLAFLLLIAAAEGPDQGSTSSGRVELHLLLPSGQPAANVAIDVKSTSRHPFSDDPMPQTHTKTDAGGVATFDWPVPKWNAEGLDVSVGDECYLKTAPVQIIPGKTIQVRPPAMVPLAQINGSVSKAILVPGLKITSQMEFGDDGPTTDVDADGNFKIRERAGSVFLRAESDKTVVGALTHDLVLAPAQVLQGVVIPAFTPEQKREFNSHGSFRPAIPEKGTIPWATGTIRDEKGLPLAGVKIYGSGTYQGAIRMYEIAASAESDAAGNYTLTGKAGLEDFSATLVAAKPGYAPGIDWITLPGPPYAEIPEGQQEPTTRFAPPPAPHCDFVLSSHGGKLDVSITNGGAAGAGVTVELRREGGSLREIWARGTEEGAQAQANAEKIAYPVQQTDATGVAHFDDLFPGRYEVSASLNPPDQAGRGYHPLIGADDRLRNSAVGVIVRAGEITRFTMPIYSQSNSVKMRFFRSTGSPVAGSNVAFSYNSVQGGGWNTSISPDAEGIATHTFESVGLWQCVLKYRDNESPLDAPFDEHYLAAGGIVAVSPLLAGQLPVKFTAAPVKPGAIVVDLQDANGRPATGFVTVGIEADPEVLGSTDANGRIRFDGLKTWKRSVQGYLPGVSLPDLGGGYSGTSQRHAPDDSELVNRMFVPAPEVINLANHDVHLILKPQAGGYIRGTLHPPKGHLAKEYRVTLQGIEWQGASLNYNEETGEYVLGPFLSGKAQLLAVPANRTGDELGRQDVNIEASRVAHQDLFVTQPPVADRKDNGSVGITMTGIQQRGASGQFAGRVFLHDGITPAYGAEVYYFPAYSIGSTAGGTTDAAGIIHSHGRWMFGEQNNNPVAGSPDKPVLVAIIPGVIGAEILEMPSATSGNLKIILPSAIHQKGQVKIGGKAPGKQPGQLLLLAQYQGKGKLNPALSISTTPQADGSFDLAGLTPGDYLVQASLDKIWISPSITIHAQEGDLPPIAIDMAEPGGPVVVKVSNKNGAPIPNHIVKVERPDGPLSRYLWPEAFETDGAGEAYIPALEAIEQTIRVDGDPAAHHVLPQSLSTTRPVVLDVKLNN